jgi:uncharacterized protein DUF5947
MTGSGNGRDMTSRRSINDAVAARKRAQMVSGLRGMASARKPSPVESGGEEPEERCDLCGLSIPADHRHLLALSERAIVCACEGCWAMRSGEGDYRPVGNRVVWLDDLDLPDDLWAMFQIPIGLAFFMYSTVTQCVVAMYPSPAGATESELHFESWARMTELNPVLAKLEPDIEGLIVNRLLDPPRYAIAPIDRCYALTGAIKVAWEGISGGTGVEDAVASFFEEIEALAMTSR